MPKRKRARSAGRFFLVALLVGIAFLGLLAWEWLVPFGPGNETYVDIPAHTGTVALAAALERGGVIRSRWVFLLLREVEGSSLKAGE